MTDHTYITLADGTKIDTSTGKRVPKVGKEAMAVEMIQQNSGVEFKASRRYVDELPASPKMLNAVAVVMVYRIFGLSDDDIAHTLGISSEQVKSIVDAQAYGSLLNIILQNIRNFDTDLVRRELNNHALMAATALTQIATDTEAQDKDRLAAANSILDRTGNRPADVVEHRHKVEGGLSIRIIEEKPSELPTINITPGE